MVDPHPAERPSLRRHRRDLFWQILLPFFLVLAGLIALGLLAVTGAGAKPRLFADISIIWLLLPMLGIVVLGLVVLIALIWLMGRAHKAIPPAAQKVQGFFVLIQTGARRITTEGMKPIVWVNQAGAALRSIFTRR